MAPSKKGGTPRPETASLRVTRSMTRKTRSSSQPANDNSTGPAPKFVQPESSKKKKKATLMKKKGKQKEKKQEEKKAESVGDKAAEEVVAADDSKKKTVVIEHCKQCNSFKTRAMLVKNGLEEGVPGIKIALNPEKPRRGCFEVREEGGETFISLLDMKRPFAPMKALDMEKVIADIIKKIK